MSDSSGTTCPECGATFADTGDSCEARFNRLLALDHARVAPFGSRHGLLFAVFALQHPSRFASSLPAAWRVLYRTYVLRERAEWVLRTEAAHRERATTSVPPLPCEHEGHPGCTIARDGLFDAAAYARTLDEWCRATLGWYGATVPAGTAESQVRSTVAHRR